jgi:hypothetical protein
MNRVLDTKIKCSACGKPALGVMFVDNKPYHRFCGEEIEPRAYFNPKEHWVLADSHNYVGEPYRKIRAAFEGQLYLGWVINGEVESCFRYDGSVIYINLTKFN